MGKMLMIAVFGAALAGCTPAAKYLPGENFADGGKTRCNTIQITESALPMCAK